MLGAVAIFVCLFARSASAKEAEMVDKNLSPACQKMSLAHPVLDQAPDQKIPHQYMLLLIFRKDQGKRYFGNAGPKEYGCIVDVPALFDAGNGRRALEPAKTLLRMENCPNDCVYPYGPRPATDDGNDPLNADPQEKTNVWGVLSAVDSAPIGGGPDRKVEVWQIPVTDACHARKLYAYYTKDEHSLLRRAMREHHMLGEILVGYRAKGNGDDKSSPCH